MNVNPVSSSTPSSTNQHTNEAQAGPSPEMNYGDAIRNLLTGKPKLGVSEIEEKVRQLRAYTEAVVISGMPDETRLVTEIPFTTSDKIFKFHSIYSRTDDKLIIGFSARENCSEYHASDAYLAQLSKVFSCVDGFPVRLPKIIVRTGIDNLGTKTVVDEIYSHYGKSDDEKIRLPRNYGHPTEKENEQMYELFKKANARSTAHMINNHNAVMELERTIESVLLSKTSGDESGDESGYELTFTMKPITFT